MDRTLYTIIYLVYHGALDTLRLILHVRHDQVVVKIIHVVSRCRISWHLFSGKFDYFVTRLVNEDFEGIDEVGIVHYSSY